MLPTNIGYEINVSKSGEVQKMTSSDFVDLPQSQKQQKHTHVITESSSDDDDEHAEHLTALSLAASAPSSAATPAASAPRATQLASTSQPVLAASKVRGQLHSILSNMSPEMRQRARPLLVYILSTMPQVDFDHKSQLYFHDKLIPKSNISRILANMLSRNFIPLVPGEKELISVLLQPPTSNFVKKIHPKKLQPFLRNSKRNPSRIPSPHFFKKATKKELLKKL